LTDDGLPPLREVVRAHGLEPRKALGQNFLFDLNLTRRIARAAGPLDGVTVLEVGPGPGGLTRALLLEGAAKVVAVERDPRALPALAEIAARYPGRLEVVEADALALDPRPHLGAGPAAIVANLPYNVGTALLAGWLTADPWPPWWASATLMFQREVAERIVAGPEARVDYGRLGVLAGWRTQARIQFDVPPAAFVPPPKVTSSVVRLVPRPAPSPCRVGALEAVTRAAFGQRRKMLRQSLKGLGVDPGRLLAAADLPETARAETVPVEGFVALANALDGRS
jgi:16S rRNA (adenine1518-N6/adenine1519-N6)-dimethyltransferase